MKLHHSLERCLQVENISLNCYHDLANFAQWLQDASVWASKQTHYQDLDIWFNTVNRIIQANLDKYGFINGVGPTNNDSKLWWCIYALDPTSSPNLQTSVASHHASAWERNQVLIMEIEYLIDCFENRIK